MKIFYTCSNSNDIDKDSVLDYLLRLDTPIVSTETGKFLGGYHMARKKYLKTIDRTNFEKIERALSKCDVAIIECTTQSFLSGYITKAMIQQEKQVLLLGLDYPKGIFSCKFVQKEKYIVFSLPRIVQNFLINAKYKALTEHIHFVVSPEQKRNIHKQALKQKVSIGEYFRKLIE